MEDPNEVARQSADRVVGEIMRYPALHHGWNELEDAQQCAIRASFSQIFLGALINSIQQPSEGLGK